MITESFIKVEYIYRNTMKYECGNCGNGFNNLDAIEGRDTCPFCGVEWKDSENTIDIDPPERQPIPDINPNPSPRPYWRKHIWRGDNERWTLETTTNGTYNVDIEFVEEDESEYFSQRSE
jgi:hypothetical protein